MLRAERFIRSSRIAPGRRQVKAQARALQWRVTTANDAIPLTRASEPALLRYGIGLAGLTASSLARSAGGARSYREAAPD